jgi:hypothetical protein
MLMPVVYFFWEGMKKDILLFVTECEVCQCNKGETIKSPGALQPLPIPASMWDEHLHGIYSGPPQIWEQVSHHGGG